MPENSQFSLLRHRRFLPFFLTQFLGAFNDNVFKNALIILIAFQGVKSAPGDSQTLVNLSAALFILSFFLFSSTAGQIGDSMEKSRLIRIIKLAEIIIMCIGVLGFYLQSVTLLMVVLFLMGTQSAVFGPVKYGYLPQHLADSELTGGNGLIEMGTFMAILLGMIYGSYMMTLAYGGWVVSASIVLIAVAGYLCSRYIPHTAAVESGLQINWNIFSETWKTMKLLAQQKIILYAVLGISWFWFLGATYMVQLPNYTQEILSANESVYIVLLALFCTGISIGSIACEKLSSHRVEVGLVPLGAIGMTVFGIDLYFSVPDVLESPVPLINISTFLAQPGSWHSLIDIVLIGIFGGVYIVPLYAVIQERAERAHLSRIIAGNNIINALMMVVAAVFAIVLLGYVGLSEAQLFLWVSILNIFVALIIFMRIPEFRQRMVSIMFRK